MKAQKIAERKKVEGRIRKAAAAAMFDVRSLTFDVGTEGSRLRWASVFRLVPDNIFVWAILPVGEPNASDCTKYL